MSRSFLTHINLNKNELQNAVAQNLGAAPSSPVKGQFYYNSTGGDDTLYWWNGSQWIAAKAAAGATPAATVTTQAVGDAPVVGISTNFAREDHKHGREAFGNVTAQTTFGGSSGNGAASSLARSDHTHGTPTHDAGAHAAIPLSALAAATANINMGGYVVTNSGAPVSGSDLTTKTYVDNLSAGLSWKEAVRCHSGGTNNGTLTGLGTYDGVTVIDNDRVLLKDQTTASSNGIWIAHPGAWVRATDADAAGELEGMAVFVMEGTTGADTAWVCTTNAPITVGTTSLAFAQFAGGGAVTAGAGMTQAGNVLNVIAGDSTLTVAADDVRVNTAQIATVSSLVNYAKKYVSTAIGDGASLSFSIVHSLNNYNPIVQVYRVASPYDQVEVDVEGTSSSTVTLRFATAPATSAYIAVVFG